MYSDKNDLCNSIIFSGAFCQITISSKYRSHLRVNTLLHYYPFVICKFLDDSSIIEDSTTEK